MNAQTNQRIGSGVYHYKKTHDLKRKDHIEGKLGADLGLDQFRIMLSVGG